MMKRAKAELEEYDRKVDAMIPHGAKPHDANPLLESTGKLYIEGKEVGAVRFQGHDGGWGFGEFRPGPEFGDFAMLFGRWSLLMHADGEYDELSAEASRELRELESAIDALHAALCIDCAGEWRAIRQLNIDGALIEWQEA